MSAEQLELPVGDGFGHGCPILRQEAIVERIFAELRSDLRAEIESSWWGDGFQSVLMDAEGALLDDTWQPHLYCWAAAMLRRECKPDRFFDSQNAIGHLFARKFVALERASRELRVRQQFEYHRWRLAS